jgi:hypothetical protein
MSWRWQRVARGYRPLLPGLLRFGVVSLVGLACEDPLVDPASVLGPRVVGARVRAELDPALSQPGAGARAELDWLVVSNRPGALSATVAWCWAEATLIGAPRCSGPTFLEQRDVTAVFGETLSLEFDLPQAAVGAAWLAWLGSCEGAQAQFDAEQSAFGCPNQAQPLVAVYRGGLPDAEPNQNPSIGDDLWLLGGAPWLEAVDAPDSGEPCVGADLLALRAAETTSIAFELRVDDREPLSRVTGAYAQHERESLVYTHLATRLGLERAFSAIDFDSDAVGFDVELRVEAAPPGPSGETVTFYFVVRDERGGVDWTRREACLLP